jgi:hypothetical protein
MLWEKSGDKYDGCGLLHCLRNLKILDEAIILADELIVRYPDFNWCRIEVIWTYIQGKLLALGEKESLGKVKEVADQITSLNPDTLALKTVVFTVIKHAKSSNNWQIVNEWIVKLDPNALDSNPPNDSLKKQEWSDQERWYNYRISGLLEKWDSREQLEKALQLTDEALSHFTEHKKFFLRLKALGYHKLGDLSEAKKQYQSLCSGHNTDWWLLHEYANVVKDMGVAPEALALMCKAALSQAPLKAKVTLIRDIGMLCKDMGNNEAARAHLILAKQVREEQGWSIPEVITATISSLNRILGDEK